MQVTAKAKMHGIRHAKESAPLVDTGSAQRVTQNTSPATAVSGRIVLSSLFFAFQSFSSVKGVACAVRPVLHRMLPPFQSALLCIAACSRTISGS